MHRARGRVLDLRGGHVAGPHAGILGHLDEVFVRLAVDVHGQCTVVGLGTRGPAGGGRGRVSHILALAVRAHREGGVGAGRGQLIQALEAAVRALEVVAGRGDFLVAHAVAEDENDVAGLGVGVALASLAKLGAVAGLRRAHVALGVDRDARLFAVEVLLRRGVGGSGRQIGHSQR